jgi:hypothetical protein
VNAFGAVPPVFWIFLGAMAAGYLAKRARLVEPGRARAIMVRVQKFVTPWILVLSFWGLELDRRSFVVLPLIGLGVIFLQFGAGLAAARFLGLERRARGAFLVGAILSNVGFLGWSVNQSLFGKPGFDTAFLYGFYFNLAVYGFAYPVAALHSGDPELRRLGFARRLFVEGIVFYAAAAIALGLALNFLGVPRPAALGRANALLVPAVTTAMLFAAGLTVRVRSFRTHARAAAAMCLLKGVLSPLAVGLLLAAFSVPPDALFFRVVVIESMTPLAITCLAAAAIFHLDQDLMNALWLGTTLFFFPAFQGLIWLTGIHQ